MPSSRPPTQALNAWFAFSGLALGQLLVDVDDVVLNIALPSIAADVHVVATTVPWIVNAYLLAFGGLLLLGGRLADRYGHRRVLLAGVAAFVISSMIGAVATGAALLVVSRAGQGLAAALLAPAAMSLLVHTFPDPESRSRALGIWGAVTGLGAVVGLVIGGVVTEELGWRWIFGGNAVVALAVGCSVRVLLPGGTGSRAVRVDPLSGLLGAGGLMATLWALHGVAHHGWASAYTAGWLGVSLLCGLAAGVVGSRSAAPLVPGSLLRDRAVVVADACALVVGAGLIGTFFFLSLHLQQVLGYSPTGAAWVYLPLVGALMVSAAASSALLPRIGARPLLMLGLLGCGKGMVLLAWLGVSVERTTFATGLLPGLVVAGLGLGLAFVGLTSVAVPDGEGSPDSGAASGLYNTAVQLGGALGVAALSSVATARSHELIAAGSPIAEAMTAGRDRALLVAAVVLAVGAVVGWLMPAAAGRGHAGVPGAPTPAAADLTGLTRPGS